MENLLDTAKRQNEERKRDWRQAVVSQHSTHATLLGLQISALILFVSFYKPGLDPLQKAFFVLALIMIVIQTVCLIQISEHERKDAFNSTSVFERNLENTMRWILNWSSLLTVFFIASLLIYAVLKIS